MKKIIFFTLFVLMFSSTFAFDVLNSDDNEQIYFNTNNDNVKVKAESNATILTVVYEGSSTRTQIYPFGACSSYKCVTFDLTDLVDSNSDSRNETIEFSLDVNGTTEKIYLDVEKPTFNLTKSDVDTNAKEIDFEFTYSDDKQLDRLELYEKSGSTETLIANISGNSYTFTGVSKSIYEFIFRVYDKAGNENEFTKTVNVGDLSSPTIEEAFLIKQDDDSFELELKLKDNEGLDKYEVTQGNINLNEDISGTSYSKTIKTPFTSGIITLKVTDNKGNSVSKSLNLNTKISNSYGSKYSDSKYFKITSNADECRLDEVDGTSENDEFDKDDDEFEVKLDVDANEEVEVKFYCQKDGFREFFEKDFFYDNEEPSNSNLSISKTDDGYLKLSWTESEDGQSDVDYILYRDDDKIYSGSKLEYVDQKVVYPNEYEYYLKVEDEAGNSVESNEVSEIPNKVKVLFELNEEFKSKVQDSNYNLLFETEKNIDVIIRVENNGKEIANYQFKTDSEKVNLNLELLKGQNIIYLDLVDEFGNKNTQDFYVIYEPVVLVESEPAQIEPPKVVKEEVIVPDQKEIVEPREEVKEETEEVWYSSWIWFIIILAAFAYFIWYFVINEDALRIRDRYRARKNRSALDKKRKIDSNFFTLKRNKDDVLAKDFNRIKNERIRKEEAKKFEELKKKKLEDKQKARTGLERKKLEDLAAAKKQEISIPFSERIKAKRRTNKIKKEVDYVDELASSKSQIEKPKKKFSFFSKKQEKEPSEMDMYLARTTQNKGWSSSSEYVFKPKPVIKEEPKEDLTELRSKKQVEEEIVPEKKGFFSRFKKEKFQSEGNEFSQDKVDKVIEESKPEPMTRKVHLDDYLSNIAKKKKRKSFYFAERHVDKDLSERR